MPGTASAPCSPSRALKSAEFNTFRNSAFRRETLAGTPRDNVNKVSAAITSVLELPNIRQRLVDLGYDPIGGSPVQYAANIKAEAEKWARVDKAAGIRLD